MFSSFTSGSSFLFWVWVFKRLGATPELKGLALGRAGLWLELVADSYFFKADKAYDFCCLLGVVIKFSVDDEQSLSVACVDANECFSSLSLSLCSYCSLTTSL